MHTHLLRKTLSQSVLRRPVILCQECQTEVTVAQIRGRRDRGYDWIQCNVCTASVSLSERDQDVKSVALADIATMDRTADALRDKDVATETLEGKMAVGDFDAFLCHNRKDLEVVRDISRQLKERGILPWLDEEQIRPGQQWQRALKRDLKRIKCSVVFVGANGVGPWQDQEIQVYLQEFARRKRSVVPVILPYQDEQSRSRKDIKLPLFLKSMRWVDFRDERSRPLERLIWGITGVKSFGESTIQIKRSLKR